MDMTKCLEYLKTFDGIREVGTKFQYHSFGRSRDVCMSSQTAARFIVGMRYTHLAVSTFACENQSSRNRNTLISMIPGADENVITQQEYDTLFQK
jgi:hypothetical protein